VMEEQILFLQRNFKSMIKQRDRAENALRDIRDGKNNPSILAQRVVGNTNLRVVGNGS
jgi:hypothetical protein